ncbi:MAG: radical SAM protein [Elusimicrobiota bacterium]
MNKFKYCYGPVGSWRLGVSLGIDPISQTKKICDFNCVYCQLGPEKPVLPLRHIYVHPGELAKELKILNIPADYITFSGRGEPTLASNLKDLLFECRALKSKKIAIITNSSLMHIKEVREELALFDFVLAKLDAPDEKLFKAINRPSAGISFKKIVKALILFSKNRTKKMAIQTMFLNSNKMFARKFAALYAKISPDEVQLNTPLRPCAEKPLSPQEMREIKNIVIYELKKLGASHINVFSVYDKKTPSVKPVSSPSTLIRRGKI